MRTSSSWLSLWGAKWVFLLISFAAVSARDLCQSDLKSNLNELIEFTVENKEKINVKEFKVVLKEGDNFNNILTPPCDPLKFPELSVEFREEGTDHWYESNIVGIADHKRSNSKLYAKKKEGKIRLKNIEGDEKLEELDYCKVYEMRLKVNEKSGDQIIKVGPFTDLFTLEELVALDEEQEDGEKEIELTYEKTEKGVQASWNDVCGKSVKIYVKIGNEEPKHFETKKDLSEHSFTIETKPCNIYMFEFDFFLAPDPEQKTHKYGAFYKGINEFISPPDPETFANIRMDESSKELSWDFSEYRGFSNDPAQAICIEKNDLKYKITFGTIDGKESHVLKEEDTPKIDKPYTFDVLGAIQRKKIKLGKCGQYEVKMEVSYKTAMNKSLSRVFKEPFNTNHDGTLEEKDEDANQMTEEGDDLNIKFGSCVKTNAQVVLVDMGDKLPQGRVANPQSGQPRIISSKEATMDNPKVSMTELKTEELQPCVSYSIQLVTQGQKDEILQTILENNHISNLAIPIDIDIRAPWGKPALTQEGSHLKVQDTEKNNRCHKEAYKIKCWEAAQNESLAEETIHPPQDINIVELNFTVGTEHICRAKIEYKAQGGDQTLFETEWSEAYTFTAPDPTTEPPTIKPTSVIVDDYDSEVASNVDAQNPGDGTDPVDASKPDDQDASPKTGGSPVGAIVGVVVVLLILALVGVAFFMYRKKNASAGGGSQDPNLSYRASATKSEATVEMGPSPLANADVKLEENQSLLTGPKADGTTAEASPAPDVSSGATSAD